MPTLTGSDDFDSQYKSSPTHFKLFCRLYNLLIYSSLLSMAELLAFYFITLYLGHREDLSFVIYTNTSQLPFDQISGTVKT